MRIHTALASVLLLAVSVMLPASALAETRAKLRLVVVDQANNPLPGAAVTIYTLDGNPGVTVVADAKGVARFSAVAPGLAQIVVKSKGFAPHIDKATLEGEAQMATIRLERADRKLTTTSTSGPASRS